MIKFFRRIRKQLVSENKFSKYLIYAIGEIVLVVIGILIALQINNWNIDEKNSRLEQSILVDIDLEISSNIEKLKIAIEKHEQSLEAARKFILLFDAPQNLSNVSDSTVTELLFTMDYNHTYDPTRGILESIISSGQINLLKNKELKYLLASVDDLTKDVNESTVVIETQRPLLLYPTLNKAWIVENGKIVGYSRKRLLDVPQFRQAVYILYSGARGQGIEEEKQLLETMNFIKSIIKQEKEK